MAILLVLAFVCGVVGLVLTSQATLGVGVIAFGCLLAIAARIAQANAHQRAHANSGRVTSPADETDFLAADAERTAELIIERQLSERP